MSDDMRVAINPGIDVAQIEEALEEGRKRIEHESKGTLAAFWPTARNRLALGIRDQLATNLIPWLGGAWTTYSELQEFKDTEKYPPGSDGVYDMFPQSIEGVLQPKIIVRCAGKDVAELPFDVTVTADFHCAALVIRDARIVGFGGGDYDITLKIALYDQDLSGPIELDKSRLPGKYTFSPGLRIV